MLDRRVAGAEISRDREGNFDPGNDQPLSALSVDGVVSLVKGGVGWREANEAREPPISYCARTSRTC